MDMAVAQPPAVPTSNAPSAAVLNSWASSLEQRVLHLKDWRGVTFAQALENRTWAMREFASRAFPRVVHLLPVLYPFSGVDALTVRDLSS